MLLDDNKPEAALPFAQELKRRANRSRSAREVLGLVYYRLGRYREALAELRAYRRMSGDPGRDVVLADIERALGHAEDAIGRLDVIVSDRSLPESERVEARIVRASIESARGSFEDALEILEAGPTNPASLGDHHIRLWYSLGATNAEAGNDQKARDWFLRVVTADPEDTTDARDRLAQLAGPVPEPEAEPEPEEP